MDIKIKKVNHPMIKECYDLVMLFNRNDKDLLDWFKDTDFLNHQSCDGDIIKANIRADKQYILECFSTKASSKITKLIENA